MSRASDKQVGGDHYKDMLIQPAVYAELNELSPLEFNIVKRISRWKDKGDPMGDLQKIKHEVDLLIYVGVGRGFIEPATAYVFQDLLGLRNATCFDVLDACASWLRAVHVARAFIEAGSYRNVLVLNAEFNANLESYEVRSTNEFDSRFPAFTIGEAATATILSPSERDDEAVAEFRSFGDQRDKCIIPLENYRDYLALESADLDSILIQHRFDRSAPSRTTTELKLLVHFCSQLQSFNIHLFTPITVGVIARSIDIKYVADHSD